MKNNYKAEDHTFAICAYKESPYLEECIISVKEQNQRSNVIMITSTPNQYITDIAIKYNIELYINKNGHGIAEDWNFAYEVSKTRLVTITHQDDIYTRDYLQFVVSAINQQEKPLMAFTDYGEIRNGERVVSNKLLNIKRFMLLPLRIRHLQRSIFIRRRILAMGSPICCPSVTFIKEHLPQQIFTQQYRSDVDWQAWERLSNLEGSFVYCSQILMFHRIHQDSATTQIIADNDRSKEDYEMFCKFWPKWMAKVIERLYCNGEKSNNLN